MIIMTPDGIPTRLVNGDIIKGEITERRISVKRGSEHLIFAKALKEGEEDKKYITDIWEEEDDIFENFRFLKKMFKEFFGVEFKQEITAHCVELVVIDVNDPILQITTRCNCINFVTNGGVCKGDCA